MTVNKLNYASQ